MAVTLIRRLHLVRRDVDVVLAGGVFRAADPAFEGRVVEGILAVVPRAVVRRLTAPPVLGAALLGLDALACTIRSSRRRSPCGRDGRGPLAR